MTNTMNDKVTDRTPAVDFNPEERLLIAGTLRAASDGGTFENVNPATEEVLGVVANGTAEDMDEALAAARAAFDTTDWSTNHEFRKRCLLQLQEALEGEQELLRAELVAEVGTPVMVTYSAQLDWPLADALTYPASFIDGFPWSREIEPQTLTGGSTPRYVFKEAVGVVGAVIPWNFPFEILVGKIGQALATGNTMVIKPASETPWNATRVGRLIAEQTDIPAGVVNIVPTRDRAVAEKVFSDPRIDMISFTGSTPVGQHALELSAPTFKRTLLELGGKSATIVLDDADFAASLPAAGAATCMHAGQGCALPTRMLLPRSRYDEGVAILTEVYQNIPYGDPTDPTTLSGPIVHARQRDKVLRMIQAGVDEGARLVVGGGMPEQFSQGFWVEPTLFVDVDNSMSIAQEEFFGPVLVVIPYDDDEDAVRIANESSYGLAGSILSGSTERAYAMAKRIRTGSLSVNGGQFYGAAAPFGGYKASGLGRTRGMEGFEQHLQTKTIGVDTAV